MEPIRLLNEKGKVVDDAIESVNYFNAVNKIPTVCIALKEVSERFNTNKQITIEFGKSHKFIGVVSEKTKQIYNSQFNYKVVLKHPAIQLTKIRKTNIFTGKKESEILKAIVGAYKEIGEGLKLTYKTPINDEPLDQLIQHDCTDWDFLLARAEANGCIVIINGDTIALVNSKNFETKKSKVVIDKSEIKSICLKSYYQQAIKEPSIKLHNYQDKDKPINETAKKDSLPKNLNFKMKPEVQADLPYSFKGVFGEVAEAKAWASGKHMRNLLARIQGNIEILGFSNATLLAPISLTGYEDMEGDTFITGTEINFQQSSVETTMTIGLAETEFMNLHQVHSPPAGNLIPGIQGLQIGYVADVDPQDKEPEDRIKVILPSLNIGKKQTQNPIWARLAFVAAGNKRGVFFTPEVGDEVLVGFLNNDPRHPLVLGCLYTHKITKEKPFSINTKENEKSGIVTKTGMALEFNDNTDSGGIALYLAGADEKDPKKESVALTLHKAENGSVEISNGKSNFISLTEKLLVIADNKKQGNKIELNEKGLLLSNGKSSILVSKDKIEFSSGGSKMTLDSKGVDVS